MKTQSAAPQFNVLTDSPTPLQRDADVIRQIHRQTGAARVKAMLAYSAPVEKTHLDRAIVIFDLILAAWIASRISIGFLNSPTQILPALLFFPVSLFIADFIGQCFHKWLDSYASETHLLWGKAAQEFRKHHEHPVNLNHVDYLSHISPFGRIMAPFFITASFIDWSSSPALGANILLLIFVLLNATEIHKQAHRKTPIFGFKWLQKSGILLSPTQHMKHHRAPFDSDYAVVNGWSHALTDKTGFWLKMDLLWWKTFKDLPRTWIQDPRSIPKQVLEELSNHPGLIPDDLYAYADAYPERSSPDVRKLLNRASLT